MAAYLSKETREHYFSVLQLAHEAAIAARAEADAAHDTYRAIASKCDELERKYLAARVDLERSFGWRE